MTDRPSFRLAAREMLAKIERQPLPMWQHGVSDNHANHAETLRERRDYLMIAAGALIDLCELAADDAADYCGIRQEDAVMLRAAFTDFFAGVSEYINQETATMKSYSELRVVDDDRDEITVTRGGETIRGWSYRNDAERRAKMLAAREFCEGWYQAEKSQ